VRKRNQTQKHDTSRGAGSGKQKIFYRFHIPALTVKSVTAAKRLVTEINEGAANFKQPNYSLPISIFAILCQ